MVLPKLKMGYDFDAETNVELGEDNFITNPIPNPIPNPILSTSERDAMLKGVYSFVKLHSVVFRTGTHAWA